MSMLRDANVREPSVFRVLYLEDDPDRAALVTDRLKADLACQIATVGTRQAFEVALADTAFDVVLVADRLAALDGIDTLTLARALAPGVPFHLLSETRDAKAAADDLSRLSLAVVQAVAESCRRAEMRAREEIERLGIELERRGDERQQALAASEVRLQAILDRTPSVVTVKDLDGTFMFVNQSFERTFGYGRAEVIGRRDREIFPQRLLDIYHANDARALQSRSVAYSEEPAVKDGNVRVCATSRFPLVDGDGKPYALCSIAEDITDRKRAENEIKVARLEAERANRAKSDFLSRMSHDLRTPLNAILGFAQLLGAESLAEGQRECVQQISKGGRHLLELINEVLDIARIETGRLSLSPEPVLVGEIVGHAADLIAPLARERNITLIVEADAKADRAVMADRQRLNQILLNLLSNAVKYNRIGGRVTLGIADPGPGRTRIVVTDTGAGIPRKKLKLLFQPFERLGAEMTGIEGTGLGLTLARGLAEAMGGSVGVESQIDKGSVFSVELASAERAPHAVAVDETMSLGAPQAVGPATVLYVEDNASNVRLMQRLLNHRPMLQLLHAPDGRSGLTMAREQQPSLVLLDLHLPDMPGESVLYDLWSDPRLRRIPVVVVSADATPGQMRRTIASGAAAYLTKPLDLHNVLHVIDKLLSGPVVDSTREVGPS
jgi:PAS domain S-box-containing protein